MPAGRQPTTDLAYIAVFAALIAALALVPSIPIGPVPITLQTLAVALTGLRDHPPARVRARVNTQGEGCLCSVTGPRRSGLTSPLQVAWLLPQS